MRSFRAIWGSVLRQVRAALARGVDRLFAVTSQSPLAPMGIESQQEYGQMQQNHQRSHQALKPVEQSEGAAFSGDLLPHQRSTGIPSDWLERVRLGAPDLWAALLAEEADAGEASEDNGPSRAASRARTEKQPPPGSPIARPVTGERVRAFPAQAAARPTAKKWTAFSLLALPAFALSRRSHLETDRSEGATHSRNTARAADKASLPVKFSPSHKAPTIFAAAQGREARTRRLEPVDFGERSKKGNLLPEKQGDDFQFAAARQQPEGEFTPGRQQPERGKIHTSASPARPAEAPRLPDEQQALARTSRQPQRLPSGGQVFAPAPQSPRLLPRENQHLARTSQGLWLSPIDQIWGHAEDRGRRASGEDGLVQHHTVSRSDRSVGDDSPPACTCSYSSPRQESREQISEAEPVLIWPTLPEEPVMNSFPGEPLPRHISERRQRLDREQRGVTWNA